MLVAEPLYPVPPVAGTILIISEAVYAGSFALWKILAMLFCNCTDSHFVACNEYSKSVQKTQSYK